MIEREPGVIAAFEKAGGQRALARALSIKQGAVTKWRRVPAERVIQIEREVGVPREVLRPDLYQARSD